MLHQSPAFILKTYQTFIVPFKFNFSLGQILLLQSNDWLVCSPDQLVIDALQIGLLHNFHNALDPFPLPTNPISHSAPCCNRKVHIRYVKLVIELLGRVAMVCANVLAQNFMIITLLEWESEHIFISGHPYAGIILCVSSQWETTLQCNVFSHWQGACTKWSPLMETIM